LGFGKSTFSREEEFAPFQQKNAGKKTNFLLFFFECSSVVKKVHVRCYPTPLFYSPGIPIRLFPPFLPLFYGSLGKICSPSFPPVRCYPANFAIMVEDQRVPRGSSQILIFPIGSHPTSFSCHCERGELLDGISSPNQKTSTFLLSPYRCASLRSPTSLFLRVWRGTLILSHQLFFP